MKLLIIDAHCHAGKGDGFTGPWDTRASLQKFLSWSYKAGVQKINLFAAFHSDYAVANAEVASIVNSTPGKFFGFAFINAVNDRGRVFDLVKTAVTKYNFCGIKVHRHDARISREICEAARYFMLPVLYDVMGEVPMIELLATEYPDVNFIIPHLSSFSDDWRAQIAFIPMLERHPNIYTDTSGVRRFDLLEMAYKRAGASKIIFGTDGPWLHPKVELSKVFALTNNTADLKKILADNFLKLTAKARSHQYKNSFRKVPVFDKTDTALSNEYRDPWLAA
ncbi:MAG: amidohydrolase family protein [Parafilimonas sp.]|nr:amidohydrolase family protein [Parafilimonas sp.]